MKKTVITIGLLTLLGLTTVLFADDFAVRQRAFYWMRSDVYGHGLYFDLDYKNLSIDTNTTKIHINMFEPVEVESPQWNIFFETNDSIRVIHEKTGHSFLIETNGNITPQ